MVYSLDGVVTGLRNDTSRDDDDGEEGEEGTAGAKDRGKAGRGKAGRGKAGRGKAGRGKAGRTPAAAGFKKKKTSRDDDDDNDDVKTAGAKDRGKAGRGKAGRTPAAAGFKKKKTSRDDDDDNDDVKTAGAKDRGTADRPPAATGLKVSRDNEGDLDGYNDDDDDDMAEGALAGTTTAPGGRIRDGARGEARGRRRGRGGPGRRRSGQRQQQQPEQGQSPRFAMSTDIHRYAEVVERYYRRFGTDPGAFDGPTVAGFMDMMKVRGLSAGRQAFYTTRFAGLLGAIPRTGVSRISDLDAEQCKKVLAEFVSDDSGYSGETKVAYAMCFKKLVQYSKTRNMGDRRAVQGDPEAYVPEIAWITPARYRPRSGGVQRKDLLTSDEFSRMVRAAGNVRDRALLWTMMEGAFRPGEILNMRVGGVEFADRYMMVSTSGKTGQKNLALVLSLQPMIEWVRLHPHADDPEAPLWFSPMAKGNGMALTYAGLAKMIRKAALKAGIKKPVWNYLLRHTQLTNMSTKLSDQLLRVYGNWKPGSKMSARYTHLSALDAKDAILAMHGIGEGGRTPRPPPQQQQEGDKGDARRSPGGGGGASSPSLVPQPTVGAQLKLHECPRCRAGNTPDRGLCYSCGLLLDEAELAQVKVTDLVRSRLHDKVLRAKAVEEELDSLLDRDFDISGIQ